MTAVTLPQNDHLNGSFLWCQTLKMIWHCGGCCGARFIPLWMICDGKMRSCQSIKSNIFTFSTQHTHLFRITTLLSAYAIWECTRQMRSCGTQSEIFVCFDDHIREIHHLRTLLSSVPFIQIHNDLIRIDLIGFFVICIWFAWTSAYSKSIEWWIISNQLINNWWFMTKCRRMDWISCGFSVNQGKVSRWALGKITFKLTYFPESTCN